MYEVIDEPIEVDCVFKNPDVIPRMFFWRKRIQQITKINGRWQRKEGKFTICCFAVSDENGNNYEIEFHTENMGWKMLKVEFD